MYFNSLTLWRRACTIVGLAAVMVLWLLAFANSSFPEYGFNSAFDSSLGKAMWALAALATACFFAAGFGTVPDRFILAVPALVTLNLALASVMVSLGLPFYGDSIGTAFAAIVGGPLLGLIVGSLTVLLWGFSTPVMLPHLIGEVVLCLAVAYLAERKQLSTLGRVMAYGAALGLISGVISALTVNYGLIGPLLPGSNDLTNYFIYLHFDTTSAIWLQSLVSGVVDKTYTLIIAAVAARYMPPLTRKMFTFWGNEQRLRCVLCSASELETLEASRRSSHRGVDQDASSDVPRRRSRRPCHRLRRLR
ncbi:hypothetical protein G7Y31_04440 [Corynebacterium lizhenjunii]|uniref:ECF transporter S component n=1 Tax=Corynebacterium lizhenjunii TaxID=2709394 RepID=A0A7T0KGF0_9CORY|nr:hypothetical protein [Corynebacterium lizhenjunii]QPK79946.1 hypothetical protein G7Y31_04440 [Corynebacterium lizhenjunii]